MVAKPPREILELAERAADLVREELGREARVMLHGSWANGTAAPRSDLDLAVSLGRAIDPVAMSRLRERIEELPTLRMIDVLDLAIAGERLRREVFANGIEL